MGRPLTKHRERDLAKEIESALVALAQTANNSISAMGIAKVCRVKITQRNLGELERFEKAARALVRKFADERREQIERFILDPESPDHILKDEEYRRMRAHYLGRLRDQERRSKVAKIAISPEHLDLLRSFQHPDETLRATLERVIDRFNERLTRAS